MMAVAARDALCLCQVRGGPDAPRQGEDPGIRRDVPALVLQAVSKQELLQICRGAIAKHELVLLGIRFLKRPHLGRRAQLVEWPEHEHVDVEVHNRVVLIETLRQRRPARVHHRMVEGLIVLHRHAGRPVEFLDIDPRHKRKATL
jgi:hypothetical protein